MSPKLNLYIHVPEPIFKARVNMTTITYPISELTYDGVTLGAFADIQFDATLLLGTEEGSDDLGRVRVTKPADVDTIFIARSGKGYEDGTLVIQNDAYITVLDDYRVWAKIPYFQTDEDVTIVDFKDGDIEVGLYTSDEIPPVSNCGPGTAGTIDSDTDLLTVQFPRDGIDVSFIIADGASISTYAWDVKDGTITVGTSASAVITATFPAGFRWVALTITDSNGISHTSRCPVLAIDPANDPTFKAFGVKQSFEKKGSTLSLEIFDEINRDEYLDGTLVMFWVDEAADPGDRDHMRFIGWLDKENHTVSRGRTGLQKGTSLTAIDVCGRLSILPGFPQALTRDEEAEQWSLMPGLDMQKALHYLLLWHSTALSVADFTLPSYLTSYTSMRLDSGAASLFDQVDGQAQKVVPDHYLTCNCQGQMNVRRDWRLDDTIDRPIVADVVDVGEWNELTYEYSRHPKYHVLRSAAIGVSEDWVIIDDEETLPLFFSIAPSDSSAFSQGSTEMTQNEGLALDQEGLNKAEGHRFALINSRFGNFSWKDPSGTGFYLWEPALMNRVQLNFSSTLAPYRGLPFLYALGMCQSLNVDYARSKYGTSIKPSVTWTKEEEGFPALTYDPEGNETTPVEEIIGFTPPDFDDDIVFGGNITGYILWGGTEVYRTWDLEGVSPTWERVDSGLSGIIMQLQYMMVDADTVGIWALTVSGIYFCSDIMAVTPTWSQKLSLATVQAGDAVPVSGAVKISSMTHYWSQPGHLCVATSPDTENDDYGNSYFWVTEDYGDNWTHVNMNYYLYSSDGKTRAYYDIGLHGMCSLRSGSPTLWAGRGNRRTGTSNGKMGIFRSDDLGYTWVNVVIFDQWVAGQGLPAMLNPYPNDTDPSYMAFGHGTGSVEFYKSVSGWSGYSNLTEPASHQGGYNVGSIVQPANKRTFDNDHVLMLFQVDASSAADLYESNDGGSTWTLLDNMSNSIVTPNGWPPDVDQWVAIQNDSTPYIRLTLDNFSTYDDKTGNLLSVATGGVFSDSGEPGGFALPKVGVNSD